MKQGHAPSECIRDSSLELPEDVSLHACCHPEEEAWVGAMLYKPDDVALGEPTYNPFAFDVGMLGNLFRVHFSVRSNVSVDIVVT